MWNIERKRAVITGAASGIGRAIACELARQEVHLLLIDKKAEPLEQTAEICREQNVFVATLNTDLVAPSSSSLIVEQVLQHLGGLDILINNAGVGYYGSFADMSVEQVRHLLEINLVTPLKLTNALLPLLLQQPRSHILNMSSMYGLFPTQRSSVYHATKYGLNGFTVALRAEYARFGLGVSCLIPGYVKTDLYQEMMLPAGKQPPLPPAWLTTTPENVARSAVKAIQKNQRMVPVTFSARLIKWLSPILPGLIDLTLHASRKKAHPLVTRAAQQPPAPLEKIPLAERDSLPG